MIIKNGITFVVMNIGFEAKRIFQNITGLGNATRSVVQALAFYYPKYQYHLYAPKITSLFDYTNYKNIQANTPNFLVGKIAKAWWRSRGVVKQLVTNKIDIYIGLAAELPFGLTKKNIKSIVFVHDIIFERYPQQYNPIDVITYRKKTKYACKVATAIVTNSEQTKQDLINYYQIPAGKIKVVYLSCHKNFYQIHTQDNLDIVKNKYNLPPEYLLSVGSIIERKGLLKICEAMLINVANTIPLVIIGKGNSAYANMVFAFIAKHNLQNKIIFLNNQYKNFASSKDLPAIYQGAKAVIYPSIFEGFGLPVLEAMASGVPVITSNCSCMPEVGGDAVLYVNPLDASEIAKAVQGVLLDKELCNALIAKGKVQAENFSEQKLAERIISVIENIEN